MPTAHRFLASALVFLAALLSTACGQAGAGGSPDAPLLAAGPTRTATPLSALSPLPTPTDDPGIPIVDSTAKPQASRTSVSAHGGPVHDYVSLIDALRRQGATVTPGDTVNQPFFTVPGQILMVNGQAVQVFEYPNSTAAAAEAARVAPDGGSVGTSMVSWVGPPHFFQTGTLIVLYVGTDSVVRGLLQAVLGAQIAGG